MSPKTATVEALLAKAESTTNAHEAEAFMAKAEELMIKHGIDAAMLDAARGATQPREAIVREYVVFTGAYSHVLLHGAYFAATAFNDSIKAFVSSRSQSHRTLHLVGFESDVAAAKVLIASLQLQAFTARDQWWKSEGQFSYYSSYAGTTDAHQKFMAKRSFVQAFFGGASARLRDMRKTVVANSTAGTDLVLVDRSKAVSDWVAENMGVGRSSRSKGLAGGVGRSAGFAAGQRADVGASRVGGGARGIGR
jgi:hypothetical protein